MTRGRKGWEQVTGPGRNCAFGGHYQPIALHLIILILKLSERRTRLLLDLRHRSGSCSASIPAKEPLTPAYIGCLFLHRFKWTHEFFPFHPKFNKSSLGIYQMRRGCWEWLVSDLCGS